MTTKVKCQRCAWEWQTESQRYKLTCPSCGIKVTRIQGEIIKIKKRD